MNANDMKEREIIRRCFAPIAGDGARQLRDDCAVITPPQGRDLVLTTDMLASGVHFLPDDPPETVAHKLLAQNLSDLAAKGAVPLGCLLGFALPTNWPDAWIIAFAHGLGEATQQFACPLLGGDTISGVERVTLSLTAYGHVAPNMAFDRRAARAGDLLVVSDTVGDAGLGLQQLLQGGKGDAALIARYRTPTPQLALGQALSGYARACTDVSDGVLRDAQNIADASGCAIRIDLEAIPLSETYRAASKLGHVEQLLFASTAGDDYELLFTILPHESAHLLTLSQLLGVRLTVIGECLNPQLDGKSLTVHLRNGTDVTPQSLGFEHS
jgi:thiamine-monophosphate kinase